MESERASFSTAALDVLQRAMRALAVQNRLLLQAGECSALSALGFHILNHTAEFLPYDRAILLAADGRMIGVSGTATPDQNSGLAEDRCAWVAALQNKPQIVVPDALPRELRERWQSFSAGVKGCAALWVPLGEGLPGLWLERWNALSWREKELESFLPLAGGYGNFWRRLDSAPGGWLKCCRKKITRRRSFIGALVLLAFLLLPVRLRIVALCEVIPEEPAAIAAKIDGVVERVLARPGEAVAEGQPLVRLEPEVVLQERQSARQALNEAHARYLSARTGALHDPRQRAQLPELANRLRQEQARLALADFRARNLTIPAPISGVAIITDPDEWAGRPVTVGERILVVADPARSRVRIFLPLTDKIDFAPQAPVKVILDNDSAASRSATLRQVAAHASERPGVGGCFFAEADWLDPADSGLSLGVSGTAVVYGQRVPLAYWLLRRPLAALRRWCGI